MWTFYTYELEKRERERERRERERTKEMRGMKLERNCGIVCIIKCTSYRGKENIVSSKCEWVETQDVKGGSLIEADAGDILQYLIIYFQSPFSQHKG
jgi:hypothetical protein